MSLFSSSSSSIFNKLITRTAQALNGRVCDQNNMYITNAVRVGWFTTGLFSGSHFLSENTVQMNILHLYVLLI